MNCSLCKKPPDKEAFACDQCKNYVCLNCSGISSTEVRVLQLKTSRVLEFKCNKCRHDRLITMKSLEEGLTLVKESLLDEIQILRQEIKRQEDKSIDQMVLINRLLNEITDLKGCGQTQSYATALKKTNEILVIKPNVNQESFKTKQEIKEVVDVRKMGVGVENIKQGKHGNVVISCSDSVAKEKIKDTVESQLGNKYSVKEGRHKHPKIIIRGVEEEAIVGSDESIIESLKEQNELNMDENSVMTVMSKYKQKGKVDKGNIILSVDCTLKNKICQTGQAGKLNIGWRRCMVHEYFSVIRCFKCARYGHMIGNCPNNTTCYNCAGAHRASECTTDVKKCINCEEINNKLKKNLDTNHSVTDANCPCYIRILQIEENKTKKT